MTESRFRCPQRLDCFQVEITTHCNLRCPECSRTLLSAQGKWRNAHMSKDFFREIITGCPPASLLIMEGVGEPTLHPDFPELIDCAADAGKFGTLLFYTNGMARPKEYYADLLARREVRIVVSVDSLDERVASACRPGTDVEQLKELLGYLAAKTQLSTCLVLSRRNLDDLPHTLAELNELGRMVLSVQALFDFRPLTGAAGANPLALDAADLERYAALRPQFAARYPNLAINDESLRQQKTLPPCRRPFTYPFVTVEGFLTPCCLATDPTLYRRTSLAGRSFASTWEEPGVQGWLREFSAGSAQACQDCTLNPERKERAMTGRNEDDGACARQSELHAGEIMAELRAALDADDAARAFELGVKAKTLRLALRDLDLLRARTFLLLDRETEAEQSLKEELRAFPDNREAAEALRAVIQRRAPARSEQGEFGEILGLVREHTMLGTERLRSLYNLARDICERDVPGNFVECGVAGGGSSALLALVLARHSRRPRRLYALDTVAGMPDPDERDVNYGDVPAQATGWGAGTCAAPEEAVRRLFESLGISELVATRKGLFQDTLPRLRAEIAPVALLHLDGDWHDSTLTVLENLHDLHAPGGYIQIDDYGYWAGCRKAVEEFQARRGLRLELHAIDSTGVWCAAPTGSEGDE